MIRIVHTLAVWETLEAQKEPLWTIDTGVKRSWRKLFKMTRQQPAQGLEVHYLPLGSYYNC
jgi:hypothetical protein